MNRGNYASRQVPPGTRPPASATGGQTPEDALVRDLPRGPERPVYHRAILYVHRDDPHSTEAQAIAPRLLGNFVYVQDVTEFEPHQRPDFLRQTPTLVVYRESQNSYDVYIGREAKQKLRNMNESEPRVGARLAGKFGACAVIPPSYGQIGLGDDAADAGNDRPDPNVDSNELVDQFMKRRAEEDRYLQQKMDRMRTERSNAMSQAMARDGSASPPQRAYAFARNDSGAIPMDAQPSLSFTQPASNGRRH